MCLKCQLKWSGHFCAFFKIKPKWCFGKSCPSKFYFLARRNNWAGGKASYPTPCKDPKPCCLGDNGSCQTMLRFSGLCWAEEDFEEEHGKGEGSLGSATTLLACHGLWDLDRRGLFSFHLKQPLHEQCFCLLFKAISKAIYFSPSNYYYLIFRCQLQFIPAL